MRINHDTEYNTILEQSKTDFNTPNHNFHNRGTLLTSNSDDAYCIGYFCLYHHGRLPRRLHKSRGHSWLMETDFIPLSRVIVHGEKDHRECVEEIKL